jgi:hypothetical protein
MGGGAMEAVKEAKECDGKVINADRLRAAVEWALSEAGFKNAYQWKLNAIELGYASPPCLQPILGKKTQGNRAWSVGTLVLMAEIFQKQGVKLDGKPLPLGFFLSALVSDFESKNVADYTQAATMTAIRRQVSTLTILDKAELAVFLTKDLAQSTAKALLN